VIAAKLTPCLVISAQGQSQSRILGLFSVIPETCKNFKALSRSECIPSASNLLVPYISVLMYTLPRDHGVSPTHSCSIMCLTCVVPRVHGVSPTHLCCIKCISYKQFQTVPNSSNQLQLIATDIPITFNIASPPDSNEASSLTFCKHPQC
jgi:hypothetical protein